MEDVIQDMMSANKAKADSGDKYWKMVNLKDEIWGNLCDERDSHEETKQKLKALTNALTNALTIIEDGEEPQEGDWVEIGGYDAIAPSTWQVFEPKDWDHFRERCGYVRILIRDGKPCIYRSQLEKTND